MGEFVASLQLPNFMPLLPVTSQARDHSSVLTACIQSSLYHDNKLLLPTAQQHWGGGKREGGRGTDWFSSSERNYCITDLNVPEVSTASCIHWLSGCSSLWGNHSHICGGVYFLSFVLRLFYGIVLHESNSSAFLPLIWFLSIMNCYCFIT